VCVGGDLPLRRGSGLLHTEHRASAHALQGRDIGLHLRAEPRIIEPRREALPLEQTTPRRNEVRPKEAREVGIVDCRDLALDARRDFVHV
jgi:hypothetical protein